MNPSRVLKKVWSLFTTIGVSILFVVGGAFFVLLSAAEVILRTPIAVADVTYMILTRMRVNALTDKLRALSRDPDRADGAVEAIKREMKASRVWRDWWYCVLLQALYETRQYEAIVAAERPASLHGPAAHAATLPFLGALLQLQRIDEAEELLARRPFATFPYGTAGQTCFYRYLMAVYLLEKHCYERAAAVLAYAEMFAPDKAGGDIDFDGVAQRLRGRAGVDEVQASMDAIKGPLTRCTATPRFLGYHAMKWISRAMNFVLVLASGLSVGLTMKAAGLNPFSPPVYSPEAVPFWKFLLLSVACISGLYLGYLAVCFVRALVLRLRKTLLPMDLRFPVLWLRSFRLDRHLRRNRAGDPNVFRLSPPGEITSIEEVVAKSTSCVGPLLAIGGDEGTLEICGSIGIHKDGTPWWTVFTGLAWLSSVVIMCGDSTASLMREVVYVLNRIERWRVIILRLGTEGFQRFAREVHVECGIDFADEGASPDSWGFYAFDGEGRIQFHPSSPNDLGALRRGLRNHLDTLSEVGQIG